MVDDLVAGRIDVALLWGRSPAGFAAQQGDALTITPLVHEAKADRMDYFIAMGVRPGEHRWKREIGSGGQRRQQGQITAILREYPRPDRSTCRAT